VPLTMGFGALRGVAWLVALETAAEPGSGIYRTPRSLPIGLSVVRPANRTRPVRHCSGSPPTFAELLEPSSQQTRLRPGFGCHRRHPLRMDASTLRSAPRVLPLLVGLPQSRYCQECVHREVALEGVPRDQGGRWYGYASRSGWLLLGSGRVEAVPVAAEGGDGRQDKVGDVMILGGVAELSTEGSHCDVGRFWLGRTSSRPRPRS
jgi:hypothetical protein